MLVVGVNGVGKTTTIGKLANQLRQEGRTTLICAADTFRAAAVDQLQIWADRAGVDIVRAQGGSDPAAVVFDAMTAAKARQRDVVLVDTAGRLHTRTNLMNELDKIRRVAEPRSRRARRTKCCSCSTRRSARTASRRRASSRTSPASTGIVLTKLDGTAKGGIAVAIAHDLKLPIRYVGVGEGDRRSAAVLAARIRRRDLPGESGDRRRLHAARAVSCRPRRRRHDAESDGRRGRRRRRTASSSARAGTRAPASRTPKSSRSTMPAIARAARRCTSPRAVLPHRPHRPVHAAHHRRRHRARRGGDAGSESAGQRQGLRRAARARHRTSTSACSRTRRARLNRAFITVQTERPADGDREGGDEPRRADRRRARRAHAVDLAPKRIAGRSGCARRSTPSASAPARCSPTIRC